MSYLIPCECGATVTISAGMTGGSTACKCGQKIKIPTLSDLRANFNEAPVLGTSDYKAVPFYRKNSICSAIICGYLIVALIPWWLSLFTLEADKKPVFFERW